MTRCFSVNIPKVSFVGQVKMIDSKILISSCFQGLIVIALSAELLFLIFSESLDFAYVFSIFTFLS